MYHLLVSPLPHTLEICRSAACKIPEREQPAPTEIAIYLDALTASTQLAQNLIDTFFVDDAHALGGYAQFDETFFALNPEAMRVQVRNEPTTRFTLGVRYIVTRHRTLAGDLTYLGHACLQSLVWPIELVGDGSNQKIVYRIPSPGKTVLDAVTTSHMQASDTTTAARSEEIQKLVFPIS
ncbi:hypothetical protein LMG33810_001451 [Carnimonas sp. LMG 33810]